MGKGVVLKSPLSSVVERVTSTSRDSGRPSGHDEVGCSIQPVGTLFLPIRISARAMIHIVIMVFEVLSVTTRARLAQW